MKQQRGEESEKRESEEIRSAKEKELEERISKCAKRSTKARMSTSENMLLLVPMQ
jgi:hypothetical protein